MNVVEKDGKLYNVHTVEDLLFFGLGSFAAWCLLFIYS